MISETVMNGVVRDRMLSRKGIIVRRVVVLGLVASLGWVGAVPVQSQTIDTTVDPEILNALYSLDFDVAERKFQELTSRDPGNPFYWNLLASAIWLEIVFEQEKLNLDSYSGDRMGTESSSDRVSPERESRLRNIIGRAITAAEFLLERNPDHIEALYALGAAHGMLASFEATVKRAYLKAHGEAEKAREYHMRVLRIDPSFNDARLTVGTYDYALGVIPGFVRFLIGVIGIRGGDKEAGIRQLEYAARLGERASTNAKMVLVVVYNREKQYDKALALLNELHANYPRNFLLEVAKASVYERMKEWPSAIRVYQSVLSKVRMEQDDYHRLEPEPVLFKIGEDHVHGDQPERALRFFRQIVASPEASDELKGRAHLWMGKIYDTSDRRSQAVAEYDAILSLDVSGDLEDEARRYRRRPFRG